MRKHRSQLDPDSAISRALSPIPSRGHLDESTQSRNSLIYIRYRDHVLFKEADASEYQPWTRETVGWLDWEDQDYVRIVWERYWDTTFRPEARLRSTGLSISKRDILELRRFSRWPG